MLLSFQYEDDVSPYIDTTKFLYKDLVRWGFCKILLKKEFALQQQRAIIQTLHCIDIIHHDDAVRGNFLSTLIAFCIYSVHKDSNTKELKVTSIVLKVAALVSMAY